jgi:hypothetical protein
MDDLDRLIEKTEREKPGFAVAVEKRKGELLIGARLREARKNLPFFLEPYSSNFPFLRVEIYSA